jgi:hypothetical protein
VFLLTRLRVRARNRRLGQQTRRTPASSVRTQRTLVSGLLPRPTRPSRRRGVAVVGFVAALLVIGTMVLWLLQATATTNISALGHFYSTGAMYAAESGLEMAMREVNYSNPDGTTGKDIDSDGTIGSISDDGNAADDPQLATGAFYVRKMGSSPPTYRAIGRPVQSTAPWNTFKRMLEFRTQ